jgi:predicted CDP-diglyceride synthetase/phosphatidate cytidylyltransferase
MMPQYTSVFIKATYIERIKKWSAEEKNVFEGETFTTRDVVQIEISIWNLTCLILLIGMGVLFTTQSVYLLFVLPCILLLRHFVTIICCITGWC